MAMDKISGGVPQNGSVARGVRRRWLWAVGIGVVTVGALIADGAFPRPADSAEALQLRRTEFLDHRLDTAPTLRVGAFNIHAGVGRDGVRDLRRTAECLANLDVVALEEVRNPLLNRGGPQAARISDLLQMAWVFVPTERQWWHAHYGNALLTRAPLETCVRIPLATTNRQRFRSAFLSNLRFHDQVVHVIVAHVDTPLQSDAHNSQLRTVCDLFLSLNSPAILMGDFNDVATSPEISRLLSTPGVTNALAASSEQGPSKNHIDWIVTKGFRTVRSELRDNAASDHPVALAELELEGSSLQATAILRAPSKIAHGTISILRSKAKTRTQ